VEKVIEVPLSKEEKVEFQASIDHVKELSAEAEKLMK
jgi:hypothetical protein